MATIIRKTVFIFQDIWDAFRTSRRWQWTACAAVAVLVVGGYGVSRYGQWRDLQQKRADEKVGWQKSTINFNSITDASKTVVLAVDVRRIPQNSKLCSLAN